MPRKKPTRLSAQETKAIVDRLLAPTQQAWQERERVIEWLCQQHGANPGNEVHRHMLFGLLAYFSAVVLPGKKTMFGADVDVLKHTNSLVEQGMPFSKALGKAIKAAEGDGKLPVADRTTHKKRLKRAMDRTLEELFEEFRDTKGSP